MTSSMTKLLQRNRVLALRETDPDLLKKLIEKYGSEDAIPLSALSPKGVEHADITKKLLDAGVDVSTADKLATSPVKATQLLNERKEIEAWALMAAPHTENGFMVGIDLAHEQTGDSVFAASYLVDMPAARQFLSEFNLDNAIATLDTTKKDLEKLIRKGLANGWSNAELGKNIADKFNDQYRGARALRIARTEMTGVINFGTHFTLEEEGVKHKRWIATLDEATRETHADLDGEREPIDGKFNVGGYYAEAPADSSLPPEERINCRCTLVSGDFDVRRKKNYTTLFLREHGARERQYKKAIARQFSQQLHRILSRL